MGATHTKVLATLANESDNALGTFQGGKISSILVNGAVPISTQWEPAELEYTTLSKTDNTVIFNINKK